MDSLELRIHRANTKSFIDERPVAITLIPRRRERTAGAGWKYSDLPPRRPQTFRIIELGMTSSPPVVELTDGTSRQVNFWILGEHDAVLEKDDYWETADGRFWSVADVIRSNQYEVRGVVIERGR